MTLPTSSAIYRLNGRVLRVTVEDITCVFPGCPEPRRTDRASYCTDHDTPTARVATMRERRRSG